MKPFASTAPIGGLSRRQFLKAAGGLGLTTAGIALLEACGANKPTSPTTAADTLETTTIRIPIGNITPICLAPLLITEDFLKAEGFQDVQYVKPNTLNGSYASMNTGDMTLGYSAVSVRLLDSGNSFTLVAGIHVGCFRLFGSAAITTIGDLKGKSLAISQVGGPDHVFMSSILANVGLDPNKDVEWTTAPPAQTKQQFIDGKIDAILAFPPAAQELKANKIGHVVLDSMMDSPWSQYFCCMATFNRDFVQTKPVATKRALRALLKAADATALHPDLTAKLLVEKGYTQNYDYALQAMKDIPYNVWRQYNPEDTLRFYTLLLRGVGLVKRTPDEIIQKGTDWRFLNELKAEMPALPTPQASSS